MDYTRCLENQLREYMTKGKENLQIKGWYFGINESVSLKAGVKNNEIGGVYSSPKAEEGTRGKLYIIWQDNRRSIASIDSSTTKGFKDLIETWRRSSFADDDAATIYRGDSYPKVNLFDDSVHRLIDKDQSLIFDILDKYTKDLTMAGIKTVDASVSASTFNQHIRNSLGLEISHTSTSFSTYAHGDGTYGKSYLSRKLISEGELKYIINNIACTVGSLKERGTMDSGVVDILLLPSVTEAFIHHYLLNNLAGSQIYNNRSAFSKKDFFEDKMVMGENLSLTINTIRDFCQGAYISTFEGVPGGIINLVENGKLKSPILDLKYGSLMGLEPTPFPAGKGSVKLHSTNRKTYEELIQGMADGIIVFDILGIHTQDATSGNYSLTAPNCIRVKNGELKEACKTVISGNIFEALRARTTELGTMEYEDNPCILMKSKVTGEK